MLQLPEALNQSTATACLQALTAAMRGSTAPAVVVDASRLSQFDSAALAVLLALRREATQLGKSFEIADLPQHMADLANLYGIAALLPAQG